jgi:hypothetical protein
MFAMAVALHILNRNYLIAMSWANQFLESPATTGQIFMQKRNYYI